MDINEICYKCGNNHNQSSSLHSLAGLLCLNRADRPDEWSMDEFIRDARKLEIEVQKLTNELQCEKDRANTLELVASKPCKDCEYNK
jgi:hypothetical protein